LKIQQFHMAATQALFGDSPAPSLSIIPLFPVFSNLQFKSCCRKKNLTDSAGGGYSMTIIPYYGTLVSFQPNLNVLCRIEPCVTHVHFKI
jgi:hypothetical protein